MKRDKNMLPLDILEQNRSKKALISSILTLVFLFFFIRYLDYAFIDAPVKKAEVTAKKEEELAQIEKENNFTTSAEIVAFGNHIIDSNILSAGEKNSGEWNYDFLYEHIRDTIQAADLAIVSQITPLTTDHSAVKWYPLYLSPAETASGLANAGFDIIASAACHAADNGLTGITDTLNIWKNNFPDAVVTGIHDSQDSANLLQIVTVNDIKIAFLNYTFGVTSDLLTTEEAFACDIFEKERVQQAVASAKSQSDCVIFLAHWGETDSSTPSEYQKQWATYLMDLGVNVIIGSHPMSVQPFGTMSDDSGNETTIFYSLGNFIAIEETPSRLLGGMARFTIEKNVSNGNTSISIKDRSVEPLIMHYSYDTQTYSSYFLKDYTEELAAQNSIYYVGYTISPEQMQNQFNEIMSSSVMPTTDLSLVTGSTASPEETAAEDNSSEDSSYEDNSYEDNSYYDSSYYDNSYYDNSYDNIYE